MAERVARRDAGFIKLAIEDDDDYGGAIGSESGLILFQDQGSTVAPTPETIPRSTASGMGPEQMFQVRDGAGGDDTFDLEFEGLCRLFTTFFGQVFSPNDASIYDNYFFPAKIVKSARMRRYYAGTDILFHGGVLNQLEIAYPGDGMPLTIRGTWIFQRAGARATASQTFVSPLTWLPMKQARLIRFVIGTTDFVAGWHSWRVRLLNNLVDTIFPAGQTGRGKPQRGATPMGVEFEGVRYWDPDMMSADGTTGKLATWMDGGTAEKLVIRYTDAATPTKQLIICAPELQVTGDLPPVSQRGAIPTTLRAVGADGSIPFSDGATDFPLINTVQTIASDQAGPIGIMYSNTEDGAGQLAP
jgi:hypothetical protein